MKDLLPNDQCCYEIRIFNRQTQQEHVFHADHHEINWERGRILNEEGLMLGFTGKERVTIKAWRGTRSWSQFQPIERQNPEARRDLLEIG